MRNIPKFALTILLFLIPTMAFGQTTVTNLNDSGMGSLRQAIIDAPDGDINFDVTGTITLLSELTITTNLNIMGPGADLVTISGGGTTRIFNIDDGDDSFDRNITISGLTLTMGTAPANQVGGAILNKESLLVESSRITNNSSGAIANDHGLLDVSKSEISGNTNSLGGAGICSFGGGLTVTQSLFVNNTSMSDGGGIQIYNSGGLNEVTNSTFNNNSAIRGGGIAIIREFVPFDDENPAATSLTLTNATVVGNHATSQNDADLAAGGIAVIGDISGIDTEWKSTLNMNNTLVAQNTGFLPNCQNVNLTQAGDEDPLINTINDMGGNLSDQSVNNTTSTTADPVTVDDFCNQFFMPQFKPDTMVLQLADNGGFTDTIEIVNTPAASNPAIDGGRGCPTMLGTSGSRDQRGFPRPFLGVCDIGAFEVQPKAIIAIKKMTSSPSSSLFVFSGSGFKDLQCGLDSQFMLGDGDMVSCTLPPGSYQVAEIGSDADNLTNIDCQGAEIVTTDSTSASITLQMDELVTCTFTNDTLDTDGDGVSEDIDLCPNTPDGNEVDEFGCPTEQMTCDCSDPNAITQGFRIRNRTIFYGTSGDDIICGTPGRDFIYSYGGNDCIDAGDGRDRVRAGLGDDMIFGGGDNDRIFAGPGDDEADGGDGVDIVNGGRGMDMCFGETVRRCE